MSYAADTSVSVEKTEAQIKLLLLKAGAQNKRRKRLPDGVYRAWEQACRARWRGLFLNIKAKLEAVEIGVTSFEEEFLAHFVLPNGRTVGDEAIPRLELSVKDQGAKLLTF